MIILDERNCKGCGICIHFCPKHVLRVSSEVSHRGYYAPYVTDKKKCAHCRQCELYCPDFAIFIVKDNEVEDG